jgi:hypothetical protein
MKMAFVTCFVLPSKNGLTASGMEEVAVFLVVKWRKERRRINVGFNKLKGPNISATAS